MEKTAVRFGWGGYKPVLIQTKSIRNLIVWKMPFYRHKRKRQDAGISYIQTRIVGDGKFPSLILCFSSLHNHSQCFTLEITCMSSLTHSYSTCLSLTHPLLTHTELTGALWGSVPKDTLTCRLEVLEIMLCSHFFFVSICICCVYGTSNTICKYLSVLLQKIKERRRRTTDWKSWWSQNNECNFQELDDCSFFLRRTSCLLARVRARTCVWWVSFSPLIGFHNNALCKLFTQVKWSERCRFCIFGVASCALFTLFASSLFISICLSNYLIVLLSSTKKNQEVKI